MLFFLSNFDKLKFRANRNQANHSSISHQRLVDSKRKNLLEQGILLHNTNKLKLEESLLLLSTHIL
jgi:hypothetical protein